jgi:hypothetical protein
MLLSVVKAARDQYRGNSTFPPGILSCYLKDGKESAGPDVTYLFHKDPGR